MNDDQLILAFVTAFRGRGDVYGNAKGFCEHQPLTFDVFEKHLRSTDENDWIGVYCMLDENCSWGCIDIDGKDFPSEPPTDANPEPPHDWERMLTLANNLVTILNVKDIQAFTERTKNGYHVWVFPEQPLVPARAMRRALMAACVALSYDPKEVNPKAEGPRPGTKGYGNFVRLPYGGVLGGVDSRRRFQGSDYWTLNRPASREELHYWLEAIAANRVSLDKLEAVAVLWTPPERQDVALDMDAGMEVEPLLPMLDGKSFVIWRDGPLPGSDRSNTLHHLAHLLAERGLTATQGFAVLNSADQRWGKFQDRPEELANMIERAYS